MSYILIVEFNINYLKIVISSTAQLLRNTLEEALTNKNKNYVGFTINLRIL